MIVNVRQIMDEKKVVATIAAMVEEVVSSYQNEIEDLVFAGIVRRGAPIAQIATQIVKKRSNINVPVIPVNIAPHNDDLSYVGSDERPVVCNLAFVNSYREVIRGKLLLSGTMFPIH